MTESFALIIGSALPAASVQPDWGAVAETPYGPPSSPLGQLRLGGAEVTVLARHGIDGGIPPHEINYRANLWALHRAGVRTVIAVNVVGGIARGLGPGTLAVPEQLIDYTAGRAHTFGDLGQGIPHIDFTEPFDPVLGGELAAAADQAGFRVARGTYGVTNGPRLETAAEVDRLERDGCTLVGMTAMPEASLARELGLRYAVLAGVVNHAAGRSPAGVPIHEELHRTARSVMASAFEVLTVVAARRGATL